MKTHSVKLQKPGKKIGKKNHLAWLIAKMASEGWNLNKDIINMVGNRIIDNKGVAVAAVNRDAVKIARAQAMQFENRSGATLIGLNSKKKFDCQCGQLGLMQWQ